MNDQYLSKLFADANIEEIDVDDNYDLAADAIEKIVADLKTEVTITLIGPGIDKTDDGRDWPHDAWLVQIGGYRTEYKCGIAHRTWPSRWEKDTWTRIKKESHISWANEYEREHKTKPVKPRVAYVLGSFIRDGEAIDQSFADWASDFGYDTDKISHLKIYNACCEVGTAMRKTFTHHQRALLSALASML